MNSLSIHPVSLQDDAAEWFPPAWTLAARPPGPLRALLCESRPGLRRQAGAALRQAALETCFAATVEEARALARRQHFHVAIVDPETDSNQGLRLCSELSRGRLGPVVPVISWCASRSATLGLRSRIAGARLHLVRPLPLDRFVNAVWNAAAREASRAGLYAPLH